MKRLLSTLVLLSAVNSARAGILLNESFAYADGAVTAVSGDKWASHNGTAGQTDVAGGALQLTEAESEDVNVSLAGAPYPGASSVVLYTAIKVRFTALPSGSGGYFAHFKDGGNVFRCRLFASTTGASEGRFRLGISKAANNPTLLAIDLSLNTTYTVVTRYEIETPAVSLWVDPASETDGGVNATDDAAPAAVQAFAFRQSLSSGNGMGTLVVDDLRVATSFRELFEAPPELPFITTQPGNLTVALSATATFNVTASGQEPLRYQWQHAATNLPGANLATLALVKVTAADAGVYRVFVSNDQGMAPSDDALLTVTNSVPTGLITNIAHLHSLLDAVDFAPSDTATLFTVEGIVTTWVNLAAAAVDGRFYLQDDSGGIAVYHQGGAAQLPPAGAKLRVTAPLSHYAGALQLAPVQGGALQEVTVLSTNNPLPAPVVLDLGDFAGLAVESIEHTLEGRAIRLDGLTASGAGTFPASGNVTVSDTMGNGFTLHVDARTDIGGQAVPAGGFSIVGVLSQYDATAPYDSGYQILPSRHADILSSSKPPAVHFTNYLSNLLRPGDALTNTFAEHGLRPGETLRIQVAVTDPEGRLLTVEPNVNGLPASAAWNWPATTGLVLEGDFTFTPVAADAGKFHDIILRALNDTAASTSTWRIYVPTAAEQRVAIAEYLANPTSDAAKAHFNPLRRDPVAGNPGVNDEYLELVNLSGESLNLESWSIADALQVRHRFTSPFVLTSSNAVVIYGGPLTDYPPQLEVAAVPASEASGGLSLNNDGDTVIVRNQLGGIVERLVYSSKMVNGGGAMTRFPTINDVFLAQTNVSTLALSPGRQPDGKAWTETVEAPLTNLSPVTASFETGGTLKLTWPTDGSSTFSIHSAPAVEGPWKPQVGGLTEGNFSETVNATQSARFYRVSSP